ncbi:glycoside hydrolase family 13 protein [Micromonospora sp. HM134]|uniref:glycoside hydrolase family 13 protein n=1 Tax=unclassified Micromonospora TaxID=2617518 RepID=UPI00119886B9|nr:MULTISPECIES: glycoside hydrolase family 13 protein [unclassified Micromonospora]QDY08029.1 glycoside hydrolase family 13 protein [Micromonospora sp. HM134]
MADSSPWWRSAVIYQVYPRSFADGDGDGIGDVAGIRSRLDHLAALGVDAIWFSPWYPSPMADAGYDVADHRDIDPVFGTLAEVEALITEAHALGVRTIVDVVPNHCSEAHPWFRAALTGGPDAPERELFWFRPGRGPDGDLPPTDWTGEFGGPTWTRTTDPDGTPGDWYLHLFAPQQPDFNWDHPRVRAEFEGILRFWFDRGVDGIRIDSAGLLVKDGTLPEVHPDRPHPFHDRDGVHDIYRAWRRIADSYPGGRALVGEVWLPDRQRFANYLRPDELHTAFNFDFLGCAWDAAALRESIDGTLGAHAPVDAPATWVLSNHDVTRHVTRYGRADTTFSFAAKREGIPTDLELGTRRARAAALLSLALPGAAYVYQGEELGLWEVEDIPYALRQDPMWERSGRVDPGRDGCRVPLPWQGDTPPFGFSPDGAAAAPWLPQPADWKDRTVRAQTGDPHSMLELYRAALALRRAEPALGDGTLTWLPAPARVLAFAREPGFACLVNLGAEAVALPGYDRMLLASGPLDDDRLPPDTAVWLRTRPA